MTTLDEAATAKTPLGASLVAGLDTLGLRQEITFTRYVKLVLPLDGYVFWVRADLLKNDGSAVYNTTPYNVAPDNDPQFATESSAENTVTRRGYVHVSTNLNQIEADSGSTNQVVFTAESAVNDLNAVGPTQIYIGEFQGTRFAFRDRRMYSKQADLYHYVGNAIFSSQQSQIIDNFGQLPQGPIVSDSLPVWIALNQFAPVYPSYLVSPNLPPPYIAAHVEPAATTALQMAPLIDSTGSSHQLAHDRVRLTLYGFNNARAIDYQRYLFDASTADGAPFGIMDVDVMRDEKQTQVELQILAQKKTFTLEVSYYQSRVQALALKFIESAFCSVAIAS